MTDNPYRTLPPTHFWRNGVAETSPLNLQDIYQKRWPLAAKTKIATAGSCFAQHISRFLRTNGYNVLDLETAPEGLPAHLHNQFGYSMYSARYGNIYTVRQLLQLAQEAISGTVREDIIWEKSGRFYDALRPNIEPNGFATPEEVIAHRLAHIRAVRQMFKEMDVFVFTLGLTEAWEHTETGVVYPTAPGTIAGQFDPDLYGFKNFKLYEIRSDLVQFMNIVKKFRGSMFRTLLTVSPVPLTATASGKHVLQASTYSKSVLRAVAGQLYDEFPSIDYFPSYEIVTNPAARGIFFASNLRSVTSEGVDVVMRSFFAEHPALTTQTPSAKPTVPPATGQGAGPAPSAADEVQCEEAMLEAFAK